MFRLALLALGFLKRLQVRRKRLQIQPRRRYHQPKASRDIAAFLSHPQRGADPASIPKTSLRTAGNLPILSTMSSDGPTPDCVPANAREFRTTHWSVVLAAGKRESPQAAAALEELCRTYWFPLYAFVRAKV